MIPYPSDKLEKIKCDIDLCESFLRDMYPQTDREVEIIAKGRQLVSCVDFLYNRLIETQRFVKEQAGRIVAGAK